MSRTYEEVSVVAMELTERDRVQLAHQLARSVTHSTPEIEEAWLDEVDRRIALQEAGEIKDIDGETLFRELRQR
jgi:putative addiction module component (TIGR02574 family)